MLRRIKSFDNNASQEILYSGDSIDLTYPMEKNKEEKSKDDKCPSDRLFIRIIDINKC